MLYQAYQMQSDLVSPLRLNITKSPVWANYPIQYLQAVNWRPTEGVVRPGDAG